MTALLQRLHGELVRRRDATTTRESDRTEEISKRPS